MGQISKLISALLGGFQTLVLGMVAAAALALGLFLLVLVMTAIAISGSRKKEPVAVADANLAPIVTFRKVARPAVAPAPAEAPAQRVVKASVRNAVAVAPTPTAIVADPAPAPAAVPAPAPVVKAEESPGKELPRYRFIREHGGFIDAVEYRQIKGFYHVTEYGGKITQHFVGSVKRIVPITRDEALEAIEKAIEKAELAEALAAGLKAEAEAKAKALAEAQAAARAEASSGGIYAPSGTHVGPRGGVYHYSKNGKKVYQKR